MPGDYLYMNAIGRRFRQGAWGIIRVLPGLTATLQPLPDRAAPASTLHAAGSHRRTTAGSRRSGQPVPGPGTATVVRHQRGRRPEERIRQPAARGLRADEHRHAGREEAARARAARAARRGGPVHHGALHESPHGARIVPLGPALGLGQRQHRLRLRLERRRRRLRARADGGARRQPRLPAVRRHRQARRHADLGLRRTDRHSQSGGASRPTWTPGRSACTARSSSHRPAQPSRSRAPAVTVSIGAQVDVHVPGAASYRDFTVLMQDERREHRADAHAVSDRGQGHGADQLPLGPAGPARATATAHSPRPTAARPARPATPILKAYVGDPVEVHALVTPGSEQMHVFSLGGESWPLDPFLPGSNQVQARGIGPWETLQANIRAGAGGGTTVGDSSTAICAGRSPTAGLWGIQRVLSDASCPIRPLDGRGCTGGSDEFITLDAVPARDTHHPDDSCPRPRRPSQQPGKRFADRRSEQRRCGRGAAGDPGPSSLRPRASPRPGSPGADVPAGRRRRSRFGHCPHPRHLRGRRPRRLRDDDRRGPARRRDAHDEG